MSGGDDWHPVGLSHSVEAGSSAGTRLFGRELVVWRDSKGVAHVWEDRCPHRGMKLSFGFVRGDHIACLYHGWQYNGVGHCQYIPAHPDLEVPNTIKVPVYPAHERSGMIWTNLSPTPAAFDVTEEVITPLHSLYFEADLEAAIAALGSVRLVPFASQDPADTRVNEVTGKLYTVTSGNDRLLIGIQCVSGSRTGLHIAISGSPMLYQGSGQRHFLDWALQLRRTIERPISALSAGSSAAGRA